jgi:ATP-binding cassette subfamily B protein
MGFYTGLGAESYDRKYTDKELIRRMLPYFKRQRGRLVLLALLILLMSSLGAANPVVVSRGVDLIKVSPTWSSIALISGAVFIVGVLSWLLNWARRRLMIRTIVDLATGVSADAFEAAANHDLSFYDEYSSGRILSRITSDSRDFGQFIALTTDLVSQVFETVILSIVLVQTEWRLTLVLFSMVPFIFFLSGAYRKLARKVTKRGMQAMAEVNAAIKETVSGIAIAKNFRQEAGVFDEFDKANTLSYRVNVRRGLVMALLWPGMNTIGGIMSAILVYTGGLSVAQGIVTAGAWYLFLLSLDRFLYPVMSLSSFITQIQTGLSAAERVFALMDAKPAVAQTDNRPVPRLRGEITFDNLGFWYKENEKVLEDFSLVINPGENLALVGHTGAGKSSLAKLVARFYEFQSGRLLVDGYDIRSFNLDEYRAQLGIVSQIPFLFSGSVLENIRYARPACSQAEILSLARRIGDGEWIETLPEGLDTQVGERGSRLSMGQRQLIALMRVLVLHPAIFILDEATASIDPFTEWQIQQALNLILRDSTSILIAHRLSTVKTADRIIVMQKGKIIDQGSHQQLMTRGGHYAELYNTYFRHQSLAYAEMSRQMALEGA